MLQNRVYTGYRDYHLTVKKLPNGKYVVDSKDKAFVEYYIGSDPYPTYGGALGRINEIKTLHNLGRFNLPEPVQQGL